MTVVTYQPTAPISYSSKFFGAGGGKAMGNIENGTGNVPFLNDPAAQQGGIGGRRGLRRAEQRYECGVSAHKRVLGQRLTSPARGAVLERFTRFLFRPHLAAGPTL